MRTGNPALGDHPFTAVGRVARAGEAMTIQGTANKAILLLLCVLVTASWIWSMYYQTKNPQVVTPWVMVGAIGGFIMALVTIFKQTWSPITAPLYALLEGLVIGGASGQVMAETAGGQIFLGPASSSVRLETAGGSIHVQGGRGQVFAETAGGSINLLGGNRFTADFD